MCNKTKWLATPFLIHDNDNITKDEIEESEEYEEGEEEEDDEGEDEEMAQVDSIIDKLLSVKG